ncbi:MAG: hypothetical protein RBQ99_07850 [Trichlorobacter sp.]|nr:hypothetical protein [Trichlorobacter sp.]
MERTRLADYKVLYNVSHHGGEIISSIFTGKPIKYNPILTFNCWVVIKETLHTYTVVELFYPWLEDGDLFNPITDCLHSEAKRFYKSAKKRFAWETKEAAMSDYVGRQRWRKERLIQELNECEAIIKKAERYNAGDDKDNAY